MYSSKVEREHGLYCTVNPNFFWSGAWAKNEFFLQQLLVDLDPAENEIDIENVDESPENLPLDTPSSVISIREEQFVRDKSVRDDELTRGDNGIGESQGDFLLRDEEYDER